MAKKKNGSMKLGELVSSEQALGSLSSQKLKAKTSFRILKVVGQVQPHLENFRKVQNELLEKHGKKNGEGFTIEPDSKNWDKYVTEMESLLEEKIDIKIKKIPLNLLTNAELTVQEASALDWLVED